MNHERAAIKGRLAERREAADKLRLRIDGGCRAIRAALNTALTPVDDLEIPMAAAQFDELVAAWAELQGVRSEIARLERELG